MLIHLTCNENRTVNDIQYIYRKHKYNANTQVGKEAEEEEDDEHLLRQIVDPLLDDCPLGDQPLQLLLSQFLPHFIDDQHLTLPFQLGPCRLSLLRLLCRPGCSPCWFPSP
jgi:hypothetical protein